MLGEELREVEARSFGVQGRERLLVVGLLRVAVLDARDGHLGELRFEREDHVGLGLRRLRRVADELEHLRDVRAVRLAQVLRLGVVLQVVVPVGEAEAALVEDPDVARGVPRVLRDAEAEARVRAREVQLGEDGGQVVGRLQLRDRREGRRERGGAGLLARRGVHAGRVEVGDFLLRCALRPVGLPGRLLEDRLHDVAVAVRQRVEAAVAAAVGRDRVSGEPRAVRELVEVLAGLRRRVEVGGIDRLRLGGSRGLGEEGNCCE